MALWLLALPAATGARILHVSAGHGDDANDGRSPMTAFATLDRAGAQLRGGDTLKVLPGAYYVSPWALADLGSRPENPVWILGEPRGAALLSAAWPAAATGSVAWRPEADGTWSAPHGPATFGGWRGHFLFRYLTRRDLRAGRVQTAGRYGEVVGPRSGFACEDGRVYVRLPGDVGPNGEPIVLSPPFWGEAGTTPVVTVTNSPGVVFDGLCIQASGIFGIKFDPASTHAVVRNCVFEYCRAGVALPSHSLVEWSEHTYPGFHELSEEVRQANGGQLRTYALVKDYHPDNWYESGIADYSYGQDQAPVGCEFRYNFLHELFDGEGLGNFDDSESHHNVYLHCYDNSVELEGWQEGFGSRNLRLHHNLMLSCPAGHISHQNPEELEGPHYVYRNVVHGYDEHGRDPWVLIKSKHNRGGGFHYYHNLFWVDSAEPYWNETEWPQDFLGQFEFVNNVFVFTKRLERPTGPAGSEQLFTAGGNTVVAAEADSAILAALLRNGGQRLSSPADLRLRDPVTLDFVPLPDSPLIDAGQPISGFEAGVVGAPDVGPFELGTEVGEAWPRPRRTVFDANPPARISGVELPPAIVEPTGAIAATLPLVRGGRPLARIVVGDDVPPAARFAAAELQTYMTRATGAELPIVGVPVEDGAVEIVVGAGRIAEALGVTTAGLQRDAFRVQTVGRRLVILGRDDPELAIESGLSSGAVHRSEHATLFGVYDFLERQLGVRWYLPIAIGEVVPRTRELSVPALDYEEAPAKLWRMIHVYYGADDRDDPMPAMRDGVYRGGFFPGFEGDRRAEFVTGRNLFALRQRRSTVRHWGSHTMWKLGDPARYADSHPEFLALYANGRRGSSRDDPAHSHHCFSDPGLVQAVVEDARAFFAGAPAASRGLPNWGGIAWDTPWGPAFHIAPDDSFQPCQCDQCQLKRGAMAADVDVEAELVWDFLYRVAAAIAVEFPDAIISTQAYGPLKAVPSRPLLENLIVVPLAVAGPYAEFVPGLRARDDAKLAEWVAVAGKEKLGFYHYALKGGWEHGKYKSHRSICGTSPRAYAAWYQRHADIGQGTYMYQMSRFFAYDHLSSYVFYRYHWDPRQDIDRLLAEYYRSFYGPAAEPMGRFWEEAEEQFRQTLSKVVDLGLGPQAVEHDEEEVWGRIYGPEVMARWRGYFERAAQLAGGSGDPSYGQRVAYMDRNVLQQIEEGAQEFTEVASGARGTRLRVARADPAPVIDGRVDEAAWRGASPASMVMIDTRDTPPQATEIRALWDDQHLYLAFVCHDPDVARARVDQTVNDRTSVWRNNGLEVFLDPADTGCTFYQWIFNSRGVWADFHIPAKGRADVGWNSGFELAVRELADRYEAEVAIPFSCLPDGPPRVGDVWRASFVRKRVLEGQEMDRADYHTWSPFLRRDMGFHRGVAFGRLDFAD